MSHNCNWTSNRCCNTICYRTNYKTKSTSPSQKETNKIKKDEHYSEGFTLENGKVVSVTRRNRSILSRESKIYNPTTKRWIVNTEQNIIKTEQDKIALQKH